jgi:hypothetical protein
LKKITRIFYTRKKALEFPKFSPIFQEKRKKFLKKEEEENQWCCSLTGWVGRQIYLGGREEGREGVIYTATGGS